jgi:hypothetical protein
MQSVYIKLLIPQIWKDNIEQLAAKQALSEAQIVRNAIKDSLNFEMDWTEFNSRNPIVHKVRKAKVRKPVADASTFAVQTSLPKYMGYVLRMAAEQKGVTVSSLVAMMLYTSIDDLPVKPKITPFNQYLGKKYFWSEAPDTFLLRASVPAVWKDRLKEYAEFNGMNLSKIVHDIIMSKFVDIKEETVMRQQKALEGEQRDQS